MVNEQQQKINQIAKAIKKASKIVLFHHERPDGDSISCSYGLLKSLQKLFPNKTIKWVADQAYIKENLAFLDIDWSKDLASSGEIDDSWTGVIGDNAVLARIFGSEMFKRTGFKICFDHHQNPIDFQADVFYHDASLGASAVQAVYILQALKAKLSSKNAVLSLLGILTDTGFFRFSLADPRPLEAAAHLMKHVDNEDLDRFYQKLNVKTRQSLAIESFLLSNFKVEGQVAYAFFNKSAWQKIQVSPNQCARPNVIGNIENTKAWILFIEYEDESVRVEFRSLGLPVNEIAKSFGGGGHLRASGAIISKSQIPDVVQATVEALKSYANT